MQQDQKIFFVQPYAKRKQAAKFNFAAVAFSDEVNVILIFDTKQSTPWPRNPLTSSRLSCLDRKRLGDNFSLGTLKNDFAALIY
jgi:hypothetical protein